MGEGMGEGIAGEGIVGGGQRAWGEGAPRLSSVGCRWKAAGAF